LKWPIAETVDVDVFIVVRGGGLMAPPPGAGCAGGGRCRAATVRGMMNA
jgi:hypothetical protein